MGLEPVGPEDYREIEPEAAPETATVEPEEAEAKPIAA
jgi:hypothetical protein